MRKLNGLIIVGWCGLSDFPIGWGSSNVQDWVYWCFMPTLWENRNHLSHLLELQVCSRTFGASMGYLETYYTQFYWKSALLGDIDFAAPLHFGGVWHGIGVIYFLYTRRLDVKSCLAGLCSLSLPLGNAFLMSWLYSSELKALPLGDMCIVVLPRFNLILKAFMLVV